MGIGEAVRRDQRQSTPSQALGARRSPAAPLRAGLRGDARPDPRPRGVGAPRARPELPIGRRASASAAARRARLVALCRRWAAASELAAVPPAARQPTYGLSDQGASGVSPPRARQPADVHAATSEADPELEQRPLRRAPCDPAGGSGRRGWRSSARRCGCRARRSRPAASPLEAVEQRAAEGVAAAGRIDDLASPPRPGTCVRSPCCQTSQPWSPSVTTTPCRCERESASSVRPVRSHSIFAS